MIQTNLIFLFLFMASLAIGQTKVQGTVSDGNELISGALVDVFDSNQTKILSTTSDPNGGFILNLHSGKFQIVVTKSQYKRFQDTITINQQQNLDFLAILEEDLLGIDELVVSATRNRISRQNAPVVVSTLGAKLLNATQSISLADGLNYAPGVRVENNCQNCGFPQVRLNGLDGPYTQILVNSRPIFSSLVGVYGIEQIPANTIEKVEVVRSGGSALYGSNAIAGTINIITKEPVLNTWEIGGNLALIGGEAPDKNLNANVSIVSDDLNSGISATGSYRNRNHFDANRDGFSEITKLKNNSLGIKSFYKPNNRSKISLNLNAIHEFRRGGDRLSLAPHLTDVTEQLDTDNFFGGLEYELHSKDFQEKYLFFSSAAITNRDSFYGGLGGGRTRQDSLLALNAYGKTDDAAWSNGFQFTKFKKNSTITTGIEYNYNNTEDQILGYNRLYEQEVNSFGIYAQHEWNVNSKLKTLIGARYDYVNVDGTYILGNINRNANNNQGAFSPRVTIMYQPIKSIKLRAGYARGFRAPQAYNEELHVASVGGDPAFIILNNDLEAEFSNAFTASFNYSKNIKKQQIDFLLEAFYTGLENPFAIVGTGQQLDNGSIIQEVQNGSGAMVYGANVELGFSPSKKWLFQLGGTIQQAEYEEPQILFESDGNTTNESDVFVNDFVRTPNIYGFLNAAWIPNKNWNVSLTGTYTGEMTVPLVISDTGFLQLNQVEDFFDLNLKLEYHYDFRDDFMITLSTGIRNLFDSYQNDFDSGPTRDSTYIYGPTQPRTYFFGIKIGNFH